MVAVAGSVLPVRRECFDAHALVRKARSRSRIAGRFGVLKRAHSSSATYKRRRCGLPVLAAAWTLLNSIAPLACHEPFFAAQVIGAGPVGLIGRNGWFVRERDVEKHPAVAGWRGLAITEVREWFNNTLFAFGTEGFDLDTWGPVDDLNTNLGLKYNVVHMGSIADGEALLAYRLDQGLPTLMLLWDPHPMIAKYQLSRVALPQYSAQRYKNGLSDFPADVVLKVEAANFPAYAPRPHLVFTRFTLDNAAFASMMARTLDGATYPQAACAWLKDPESQDAWSDWIPPLLLECAAGERLWSEGDGAAPLCELCPAGYSSRGGRATKCQPCSPGIGENSLACRCCGERSLASRSRRNEIE